MLIIYCVYYDQYLSHTISHHEHFLSVLIIIPLLSHYDQWLVLLSAPYLRQPCTALCTPSATSAQGAIQTTAMLLLFIRAHSNSQFAYAEQPHQLYAWQCVRGFKQNLSRGRPVIPCSSTVTLSLKQHKATPCHPLHHAMPCHPLSALMLSFVLLVIPPLPNTFHTSHSPPCSLPHHLVSALLLVCPHLRRPDRLLAHHPHLLRPHLPTPCQVSEPYPHGTFRQVSCIIPATVAAPNGTCLQVSCTFPATIAALKPRQRV